MEKIPDRTDTEPELKPEIETQYKCNHCDCEITEPNRQDPSNKMFICEVCWVEMININLNT